MTLRSQPSRTICLKVSSARSSWPPLAYALMSAVYVVLMGCRPASSRRAYTWRGVGKAARGRIMPSAGRGEGPGFWWLRQQAHRVGTPLPHQSSFRGCQPEAPYVDAAPTRPAHLEGLLRLAAHVAGNDGRVERTNLGLQALRCRGESGRCEGPTGAAATRSTGSAAHHRPSCSTGHCDRAPQPRKAAARCSRAPARSRPASCRPARVRRAPTGQSCHTRQRACCMSPHWAGRPQCASP
jgi:hypothetical protein